MTASEFWLAFLSGLTPAALIALLAAYFTYRSATRSTSELRRHQERERWWTRIMFAVELMRSTEPRDQRLGFGIVRASSHEAIVGTDELLYLRTITQYVLPDGDGQNSTNPPAGGRLGQPKGAQQ